MPPWSLYFRLSAALLLFATALPASQLVTAEVPVLLATALRMTAAAAVFVPVLWLRREDVRKLSPRDARWIGVIAAFGLIGSSALMLCGTRLLSCGAVCLLTTTTPAMTAAGAAVFLRDRPNWQKISWLALGALAAIGLALHWSDCGPIAESPAALLLGGALVAAAICCEASYTLAAKVVTARTAPLTVAAVSTIAAAVALAPPAAVEAATFDWDGLSPLAALAAVWWGAGALALGSWLWYSGVRQVRGSTAAAAMTALPVCTLLLSQLVGD